MLRTIGSSIARKIRETGGAILGIGGIADGEFLQRSGDDIVGASGTGGGDTLPVVDTKALVKDPADATKLVRIDAGAITTGTTRVITIPDEDVDLGALLKLTGGTLSGLLQFSGTGHAGLQLNSLSTTQRNALTPAAGMVIWNSTTNQIEGYDSNAAAWVNLGLGVLDEDDMASDSATKAPSQQSVKAYVDAAEERKVEWFRFAGSFLYPSSNAATLAQLELTNGKLGCHLFDDTTEEFIYGSTVVPADLKGAGSLTVYVYHTPVTAAASKNTEYRLGYKTIADGEDLDATYTNSDSGDLAMNASQDYLNIHSWTISQSSFTAGDLLMFRLSRIAPTANNLVGDDRGFLLAFAWECV